MLHAPTPPNLDELNPAAMKALVAGLYAQIEHLKLVIAKLRRMQFGRKSEKVSRHIEQLELQLEGLYRLKQSRRKREPPSGGR